MNMERQPESHPPSAGADLVLFSPRERFRDILMVGLAECGFRVVHTPSPYCAVMQISQAPPQAVIIDVTHDNIKGLAIAFAASRSDRTAGVRVVLMVPSGSQDLLVKAGKEYGLDDLRAAGRLTVLSYPLPFHRLVAAIREGIQS